MQPYSPLCHPSVLIVKTSSLGDIIQAFSALDALDEPADWVVDARFASLVAAHPKVHRAISVELATLRGWRSSLAHLRETPYDVVFDLQGNTKSAVLTFAARAPVKVGFGPRSVREWPNLFATNTRFEVERALNIRSQYASLIEQYFQKESAPPQGVELCIVESEQERIEQILARPELAAPMRFMVCPGSKWPNKQLTQEAWGDFLQRLHVEYDAAFLLMWGDATERAACEKLGALLPGRAVVVERLSLTTWQNLMSRVDCVLAVDSSALHLCGTTTTPSFSVFGPTKLEVFKPLGEQHVGIQGACPYGQAFIKQCPRLRTCPTGACIRSLTGEALFEALRTALRLRACRRE